MVFISVVFVLGRASEARHRGRRWANMLLLALAITGRVLTANAQWLVSLLPSPFVLRFLSLSSTSLVFMGRVFTFPCSSFGLQLCFSKFLIFSSCAYLALAPFLPCSFLSFFPYRSAFPPTRLASRSPLPTVPADNVRLSFVAGFIPHV